MRFHRGTGQLTLTGDRDARLEIGDPPSSVYGIAYVSSSSARLRLEFTLSPGGVLSIDIAGFTGAGSYTAVPDVNQERRRVTLASPDEDFGCYSGCGACTVTVDAASRQSMSGSFRCSSLLNCVAAQLRHEQPLLFDGKPCTGTAATVDMSGTFRLDDPTDGIRNY